MIARVRVRYFKQFYEEVFALSDHIILAGPNNSGKTTLLQAIATWNLALQRWRERRGPESGSKAKQRTGVPLTRQEFTALPLREMSHLWADTLTGLRTDELKPGQKLGQPRALTIGMEGTTQQGEWRLAFELRYQSSSSFMSSRPQSISINYPRRLRTSPWYIFLRFRASGPKRHATTGPIRICSLDRARPATSCAICCWRSTTGRTNQTGAPSAPRSSRSSDIDSSHLSMWGHPSSSANTCEGSLETRVKTGISVYRDEIKI